MRKYFYLIMLMLIIVATFLDLPISELLYGLAPRFSIIEKAIGATPLGISISLGMLYYGRYFSGQRVKQGFFLSVVTLVNFLTYYSIVKYLNLSIDNLLILSLSIVTMVVSYYIMSRVSENKFKKYQKLAFVAIVMPLTIALTGSFLKVIFARPRYFTGLYGPWYQISGPTLNNDYMSFISGHSANSLSILLLSVLPAKEQKKTRMLIFAFGMLWAVLVGLGRIFIGEHYLSDVLFSLLIATSIFFYFKDRYDL